jgi:hypothetical protein
MPSETSRVVRLAVAALAVTAAAGALACSSGGGAGDTSSVGGASSGGAPAPTVPCDAGVACPTAASIGHVSGDTRADTVSADGTTSTWLHVTVTEDDSAWAGRPVRLRATLTSAAAGAFELHAYLDVSARDDAGLDCVHDVARSVPGAGASALDFSWGDPPDGSANGYDDGRTVALEVRNVSGTCAAGAPWHLDVRGN